MKREVISGIMMLLAATGTYAGAQEPCGNYYNCNNAPCTTVTPCVDEQGNPANCYTQQMGCGYEYCNQPALVQRYAELAQKYHNLGPNDRWAEIYNGNNEVKELQQLDNYYSRTGIPEGLTPEQELQLRAATGAVNR